MAVRLVLAVVVVALLVVCGPLAVATVTGRPLIMDCQELTTATCDEALAYWSASFERSTETPVGPIVGFWFKSTYGDTCGDVDIKYWTLFGPGDFAQPLC
jgi:hypothetical protein